MLNNIFKKQFINFYLYQIINFFIIFLYFFTIMFTPLIFNFIKLNYIKNNYYKIITMPNKNFVIKNIVTSSYINNGQILMRHINNNNLQSYVIDAKGSVLKLNDSIDTNNNKIYSYDAYGNIISNALTSSGAADIKSDNFLSSSAPNNFQYNSERFDANTGLQYLRARFYYMIIKRFITQDDYDLLNKFNYANLDPVMHIDPAGHNSDDITKYIVGSVFAVGGILSGILAAKYIHKGIAKVFGDSTVSMAGASALTSATTTFLFSAGVNLLVSGIKHNNINVGTNMLLALPASISAGVGAGLYIATTKVSQKCFGLNMEENKLTEQEIQNYNQNFSKIVKGNLFCGAFSGAICAIISNVFNNVITGNNNHFIIPLLIGLLIGFASTAFASYFMPRHIDFNCKGAAPLPDDNNVLLPDEFKPIKNGGIGEGVIPDAMNDPSKIANDNALFLLLSTIGANATSIILPFAMTGITVIGGFFGASFNKIVP